MGAMTIGMSEAMQAFVETQADYGGFEDGGAYVRNLIEQEHRRKVAALREAIQDGLDSGVCEGNAVDVARQAFAEARIDWLAQRN